jgi:hypothetical protein
MSSWEAVIAEGGKFGEQFVVSLNRAPVLACMMTTFGPYKVLEIPC